MFLISVHYIRRQSFVRTCSITAGGRLENKPLFCPEVFVLSSYACLDSLTSCVTSLRETGRLQRRLIGTVLCVKRSFMCPVHSINQCSGTAMLMCTDMEGACAQGARTGELRQGSLCHPKIRDLIKIRVCKPVCLSVGCKCVDANSPDLGTSGSFRGHWRGWRGSPVPLAL